MKPLDFSRKLGAHGTTPPTNEMTQDTSSGPASALPHGSLPERFGHGSANNGIAAGTKSPPSGQPAAPTPLFDLPFPTTSAPQNHITNNQGLNVTTSQPPNHQEMGHVDQNGTFQANDVTFVNTDLTGTLSFDAPEDQNQQLNSLNRPIPQPRPSIPSIANQMAAGHFTHNHSPQPVSGNRHKAVARGNSSSKVTKSRKKKRQGPDPNKISASKPENLDISIPDISIADDQLLQMMMFKNKKAAEAREAMQAQLQDTQTELQDFANAYDEISHQLQGMTQLHSEKEARLAKLIDFKNGCSGKVKKLSDYVRGLSNDHNKLRDDAHEIREAQGKAFRESAAIFDTLRNITDIADQSHTKSKQFVTETHKDMENLNQMIQRQRTKLKEDAALLSNERERNDRLEEQISAFTDNQAQLMTLFAGHREAITGQLSEILAQAGQAQAPVQSPSHEKFEPMLEQCHSMLQNIPKFDGSAKKEDVEDLKVSMRSCFDK